MLKLLDQAPHRVTGSFRDLARLRSDAKAREVAFWVAQPGCGARREHTGAKFIRVFDTVTAREPWRARQVEPEYWLDRHVSSTLMFAEGGWHDATMPPGRLGSALAR